MEMQFESRLASLEHKFDARSAFSKIADLDNRLAHRSSASLIRPTWRSGERVDAGSWYAASGWTIDLDRRNAPRANARGCHAGGSQFSSPERGCAALGLVRTPRRPCTGVGRLSGGAPAILPSPQLALWRESFRDHRRQGIAGGGGERLGFGIRKLSIPFQRLPRRVRPLYANRLARH